MAAMSSWVTAKPTQNCKVGNIDQMFNLLTSSRRLQADMIVFSWSLTVCLLLQRRSTLYTKSVALWIPARTSSSRKEKFCTQTHWRLPSYHDAAIESPFNGSEADKASLSIWVSKRIQSMPPYVWCISVRGSITHEIVHIKEFNDGYELVVTKSYVKERYQLKSDRLHEQEIELLRSKAIQKLGQGVRITMGRSTVGGGKEGRFQDCRCCSNFRTKTIWFQVSAKIHREWSKREVSWIETRANR